MNKPKVFICHECGQQLESARQAHGSHDCILYLKGTLTARLDALELRRASEVDSDLAALYSRTDALTTYQHQFQEQLTAQHVEHHHAQDALSARLDTLETFTDDTAALFRRRTARHDTHVQITHNKEAAAIMVRFNALEERLVALERGLNAANQRTSKQHYALEKRHYALAERVAKLESTLKEEASDD